MKGLERMISRVRTMLTMGQAAEQVYEDLLAQGVDKELAHWAIHGAKLEIKHWKKQEAANNEND